jgi:chromosome segregation ATPase
MRLQELGSKATSKRINKINESRFGFAIDYSKLTIAKAQHLSRALGENLNQLRRSYGAHTAEKNPKYMELLMVREGLQRWVAERRSLNESEMGKSEAILAAKDMVDSIQDMIEDVSKMQNEQMPALIDTIRDQIGTEQADQFKGAVGQVLGSILQQLTDAREQTDNAARNLAGEGSPDMGMGGGMGDLGMGGGMPGAAPGMGPESDLDIGDEFGAADAAAGGAADLGREKR